MKLANVLVLTVFQVSNGMHLQHESLVNAQRHSVKLTEAAVTVPSHSERLVENVASAQINSNQLIENAISPQFHSKPRFKNSFEAQILSKIDALVREQQLSKTRTKRSDLKIDKMRKLIKSKFSSLAKKIEDQPQGSSQTLVLHKVPHRTLTLLVHTSAESDLRTTLASKINQAEFDEYARRCYVDVGDCMFQFATRDPFNPDHEEIW